MNDARARPLGAASGAACGWVLHDLLVLLASPEPQLALRILPGSLAAVALAAAAGALVRWIPLAGGVMGGLAALLSVASLVLPIGADDGRLWLPRAALLLWLAAALALKLSRRFSGGTLRIATALGALASLVPGLRFEESSRRPLVVAAAALLLLLLGRVRAPTPRRVLVAALLATLIVGAAGRGLEQSRLPPSTGIVAARDDRAADPPTTSRRNVLLIVLDTVAASHLAPWGYPRRTTPGLDAFAAARAEVHLQYRSNSPWTLPSHASLFSGLLPSEHGAHHPREGEEHTAITGTAPWPAQRIRPDVPLLAERLARAGYRTSAIVANHFFLNRDFGLDRGFQHYDDRPGAWVHGHRALVQLAGIEPTAGHTVFRRADRITDLALEWLAASGGEQPFFLFLNYMDAHRPYLAPAPFDTWFTSAQPADLLHPPQELMPLLYDRALASLDAELSRLLQTLERRGRLADTTVVITSDHGEAFGEHGHWAHDDILYDEVLRVPLYIARPGAAPRVSLEPIDGIGLHRLLLAETGLDPGPPRDRQGLLAEYERSPERTELGRRTGVDVDRDLLAWLDPPLKSIVSSRGTVEVYDLARDPAERQPVALPADVMADLLARSRAWWAQHRPPSGGRPSIDPETAERLKSVGYLAN